jgi:hypothetical protein
MSIEKYLRYQGLGFRSHKQGSNIQKSAVQGLNSEPQNRRMMNRRISKGGFALLNLFYKKDRSTLSFDSEALAGRLTTGRIHSFDIQHSIFNIRFMTEPLNPEPFKPYSSSIQIPWISSTV